MTPLIDTFLLGLFAIHLAAFVVLGVKRQEPYYLALVVTFSLLCAVFATRLFAPDFRIADVELDVVLRYTAWVSAAISISWTLVRALRRRADRAGDGEAPDKEPAGRHGSTSEDPNPSPQTNRLPGGD